MLAGAPPSPVHPEAELALEPHCPKEPERVVEKHSVGHCANDACLEVGPPAVRVEEVARADPHGDRIEGEVARNEICLDAVRERREVDCLLGFPGRYAPGSVSFRKREHCPAESPRKTARRVPRVVAGDVEIQNGPAEEHVADRAADDPGLLVGKDLADSLIHRGLPAAPVRSGC